MKVLYILRMDTVILERYVFINNDIQLNETKLRE
jgi:hypothetical protein